MNDPNFPFEVTILVTLAKLEIYHFAQIHIQ